MSDVPEVTDNPVASRFEILTDQGAAILTYRHRGDDLDLVHTEVPKALEGKGIGSALVKGLLEHARAQGLKIHPLCPFVVAYMQRHPDYEDVRG